MTPRWIALSSAFAMAVATFTVSTSAHAVVCSSDAQCAATPQTPACNTVKGVCEECTATNVTRCSGSRTPVCLPQYGICGCTDDSNCGGGTSGQICTHPTGSALDSPPYCTAGCVNDGAAGRNGCAAGQTCTTAGQCEQICDLNDPMCPAETPRNTCALLSSSGAIRCVECQNNTQCAGKRGATVCDTTTNTCVQCNGNADCAAASNGHICRPGASPLRSCGCNSNNDCPAGRTCDPNIKACVVSSPGDAGTGDGGADAGDAGDAGRDGSAGDGGSDGSAGDAGNDGSAGDGGNDGSAGDGGEQDGSTADGSTDDGSAGDGSADGGADVEDSGRIDAGDAGNDGGGTGNDGGDENPNDGNYMTSLEGGGCDCSVVPSEDSLPIGGLLAVGGFFAFFTRRRARGSKKDEGSQQP